MPYKTDKLALNDYFIDRRTKMLPCQKERAKQLYEEGMAIRAIARMFHVDKRLIQFLLFPERQKKNLQDREKRGGWKQYYDKDIHKESTKEHRKYKYKVLKNENRETKTTGKVDNKNAKEGTGA